MHFFEGELRGEIVSPRGRYGFEWDKIFKPKGLNKTLAELTMQEKNKISMRIKAVKKLKEFLNHYPSLEQG